MNNIVLVGFLGLATLYGLAEADAQPSDRLVYRQTRDGLQVAVSDGGAAIPVTLTCSDSTARLADFDGDGIQDVAIDQNCEDDWAFSLWLRRGEEYVQALEIDHPASLTVQDVDGDGTTELLLPRPDARSVFSTISIHEEFRDAEDSFRMYRYASGRYVPARIECVAKFRHAYLSAIDAVELTLKRNQDAVGSSYEDNSFTADILVKYLVDLAQWRKRFSDKQCDGTH